MQFNGQNLLTWVDKNGIEHKVTLDSNNCDSKRAIWQTDSGFITEKDLLPIQGNLLRGIDNCLGVAWSAVQVRSLDNSFGNIFFISTQKHKTGYPPNWPW